MAWFSPFLEIERRLTDAADSLRHLLGEPLQPVTIERRVIGAMQSHREVHATRVVVPNLYRVRLAEADFGAFGAQLASLTATLEATVRREARAAGFEFLGPPRVELAVDPDVPPGHVHVDYAVVDPARQPVSWRSTHQMARVLDHRPSLTFRASSRVRTLSRTRVRTIASPLLQDHPRATGAGEQMHER